MAKLEQVAIDQAVFSIFEYLYRDSANYKAFGSIVVRGAITGEQRERLIACLDSSEYFVAKQVGIPELQSQLWGDGGAGANDHDWHSFFAVSQLESLPEGAVVWGTLGKLLNNFECCLDKWSPAFENF